MAIWWKTARNCNKLYHDSYHKRLNSELKINPFIENFSHNLYNFGMKNLHELHKRGDEEISNFICGKWFNLLPIKKYFCYTWSWIATQIHFLYNQKNVNLIASNYDENWNINEAIDEVWIQNIFRWCNKQEV